MIRSIIGVFLGNNNRIRIQLDRDMYFTGDELTGSLLIDIPEATEYSEISLKIKGTENVDVMNLDEFDSNGLDPPDLGTSCHYNLAESFLDRKYVLNGKKSVALPRGHYILPFSFVIPSNLPGSLHYRSGGLHARVVYLIEAEVCVPGLLRRNLKSPVDEVIIRQSPPLPLMPLQMVFDLHLRSFWCTSFGSIELAASLDRNSYAPGDRINLRFAADTTNCCSDIKNITVILRRVFKVFHGGKVRKDDRLLSRVRSGRIKRGERVERRATLSIPDIEPYSMKGKLIECRYELTFIVKADWCLSREARQSIQINDSRASLPTYSSILNVP